jgi:hypothetical protein
MEQHTRSREDSPVEPVKAVSEFQRIFDLLSAACDVSVRIADYPFRSQFIFCAAILGRVSELGINEFCKNAGYDEWFLYYHPGNVSDDQYSVNAEHYPLLRVTTTAKSRNLTDALRKRHDEWLVSRLTICFSRDMNWVVCFDADLWFGVIGVTSDALGTRLVTDYVKFDSLYKCRDAIADVATTEYPDDPTAQSELTQKVLRRYGDCDYTKFLADAAFGSSVAKIDR